MLILLAEDDRIARLTMEKCLRLAGHEVVKVDNGQLALEILACNAHFHMLITDIQMPIQSGLDVIRCIRGGGGFRRTGEGGHELAEPAPLRNDLPIIAVSGTVTVTEVQRVIDAGADRFLAKPVRRPALLREVESLRREHDARAQMRTCA